MILILLVAGCEIIDSGTGKIEIESTPQGAEINLDDDSTGFRTNYTIEDLEPGTYNLRLELDGYWGWETNIIIKAGKSTSIHALLGVEEGVVKWIYDPEEYTGYSLFFPPAISSDATIYIGGRRLYAISPGGLMRWDFNNDDYSYFYTPAVASDGTIYIKAFEDSYIKLYAFDASGREKWALPLGEYYWPDDMGGSLGIDEEGTVYVVSSPNDSFFYARNPDGTEKWKYNIKAGTRFSTIAISEDGTIYLCANNWTYHPSNLYAFSSDGELNWKYSNTTGNMALGSEGTIYVGVGNDLRALTSEGKHLWTCEEANGKLAVGSEGTIYSAGSWDTLRAIDQQGNIKWKFYLGENTYWKINTYPAVGSDGIVYIGGFEGYLYALNPDGTLHWKLYLGSMHSCPAISSEGILYINGDNRLYAIATSSRGLASSPWPKYGHDNQNTGRAGY